jgi:hypothetical protein
MESLIKLVTENGLGVASFCALCYGGWQVIRKLELMNTNHLTHIQSATSKTLEAANKTNEKLDELIAAVRSKEKC